MCEQIIKQLFMSGLRMEIRQQVELNLSACKDNQGLLKAALTVTSRSVSEISKINSLRQELAAMRLASAGTPQNRHPPRNWSQNHAQGGAHPEGNMVSRSMPPPQNQSYPTFPVLGKGLP